MDVCKFKEIENRLQYSFGNDKLLEQAFTHSSFGNQESVADNERMEFLGDAILGYLVSEQLFATFNSSAEGALSAMRAKLVSAESLSKIVDKLDLTQYLQIVSGHGANGELSHKTQANLYEAILCAIYLDGGIAPAREFVLRTIGENIRTVQDTLKKDAKTLLQEYCQKHRYTLEYKSVGRSGPDNKPTFKYALYINGKSESVGVGPSKKAAEQDAAGKIVKEWGIE
ncbi:MAG: ribonuclease III [Clostridiales bacterium]|nr:ribonuclease III [Clostridiales bacterium]